MIPQQLKPLPHSQRVALLHSPLLPTITGHCRQTGVFCANNSDSIPISPLSVDSPSTTHGNERSKFPLGCNVAFVLHPYGPANHARRNHRTAHRSLCSLVYCDVLAAVSKWQEKQTQLRWLNRSCVVGFEDFIPADVSRTPYGGCGPKDPTHSAHN